MRRGYTREEYLDEDRRGPRPDARTPASRPTSSSATRARPKPTSRRRAPLLEELRFDKVHVAAYSPRPGTIAWRKMEDDVPAEVKAARLHRVEEIEGRISQEINATYVGTVAGDARRRRSATSSRSAGRARASWSTSMPPPGSAAWSTSASSTPGRSPFAACPPMHSYWLGSRPRAPLA